MKKLINMLKKDEETISIGRICAVLAMVLFIVVSLFLAFSVKTWGNYDTFAWVCLAFVLVQLGNKAIETRMFKIGDGKQ
ncbi:hypothetical protein [Phascolarctobacterium succinatutens]|uniref:hypothetical protein n=1 Tax=Phascolarctobacterium succinatutens TaxID=626940 RepID=UPI003AAB85C8